MKPYTLIILIALSISSCSGPIPVEKATTATHKEAYQVVIADPNGPGNFYNRLYDSLNFHIGKINGSNLNNLIDLKGDADSFSGWLQDQFDNEKSGLGLKASSESIRDRTSDEFLLKGAGTSSKDKASFSVSFRTDSIAKELLYPALWEKAITQNGLEKKVQVEKEKFQQGGTLIRSDHENKDTLYVYTYQLNIDITLNYYINGKGPAIQSAISIPAVTGIYHQLKFQ